MTLIPVEGKDGLFRDSRTNAIVNKNDHEYQSYIANRNKLNSEKEKMKELENKVESLSSDIGDIKNMLSTLLNRDNG